MSRWLWLSALLMLSACGWQVRAVPPLPQDLPADWRVEFVRDTVFGAQMLVVEAGSVTAPPVVLVHGLGQNGLRDWLPVMAVLARQYRVIALDLPGFGHSEVPTGRYSPTHYAQVLQALLQRRIEGPAMLVGHSLGGAVALRYADLFPADVSRAVLVDVAGILERTAYLKHQSEFPGDWEDHVPPLRQIGRQLEIIKDATMEWLSLKPNPVRLLGRSDAGWDLLLGDRPNANAALALIEEDYSLALRRLTLPVHLIWGGQDRIAPLRTAQVLDHLLANSTLHVITEAGHVPMQSHPAQFNRLLLAALQGASPLASAAVAGPPPGQASAADAAPVEGVCRSQSDKVFSGHYDTLTIERCRQVTLRDVTARQLIIRNSRVTLERVRVVSDGTAVILDNSALLGTAVYVAGAVAVVADRTRVDLAAAELRGTAHAVTVTGNSRFLLSVSELHSPQFSGTVHGLYSVTEATLDSQLVP